MKKILWLLLLCLGSVALAGEIQIDCDFPGGNILVDSIKDGVVRVRPDQRGSTMNWFYYAFRVRNAQGQTLRFVFDQPNRVGSRGPAISTDNEKTWRYLSDKPEFHSQEFTYTFGPEEKEVKFAQAILYTQKNWDAFIAAYREKPTVRLSTLCRTRKGRDVELLRFGNENGKFGMALTCRHHCCEMTASFVLEGILEEAFSDTEAGRWLRENVAFYVVPFVDKDGVEDGDQGKGRAPHDHNRDYNHELYPEIKALKQGILEAFGEKKLFFQDLHCPWIRSGMNEYLYSPMSDQAKMSQAAGVYFKMLETIQKDGEIPYVEANNLPFGQGWNNAANFRKMENGVLTSSAKMWVGTLPNTIYAGTLEMPYSNSSGVEVTRENSRELGRNMAKAMAEFLKTQGE
ncbi:MAG: M14-type cytosolic carboxypeptidase [Planctomycetia bacterium]|nr:M14-type cytosolic carboxypeptidase [Planctomycetia bacterium]